MDKRSELFVCAFRREWTPDDQAILVETEGRAANICPRCLELIIVHRRYHSMKVECVILQMAE